MACIARARASALPGAGGQARDRGRLPLERNARFYARSLEHDKPTGPISPRAALAGAGYRRALEGRWPRSGARDLHLDRPPADRGGGWARPRRDLRCGVSSWIRRALRGVSTASCSASTRRRRPAAPGAGCSPGAGGVFDPTGSPGARSGATRRAGAFMPLWFTDRTLALAAPSWIEAPGNGTVPFTRLVTNYSGKSLRGYGGLPLARPRPSRSHGGVSLAVWALDRAHGTGVDAYAS